MKIKTFRQFDLMDCAPVCLKMIANFYGKNYSIDYLRTILNLNKTGVSILSLNNAAKLLGFEVFSTKISLDKLILNQHFPAILYWDQNHFVVISKISRGEKFTIHDPAHGKVVINKSTFKKKWVIDNNVDGIVIFLNPQDEFYNKLEGIEIKNDYSFIFKYLSPFKKNILQLLIGMIAASFISLLFPLLTQILIDNGVGFKSYNILVIVFISQIFLFLGDISIGLIRSWLLLYMNSRISLNIVSDFLIKLLNLPIKYFETKAVGDISQRINDHHRIENFLTSASLNSLFSFFNIFIFSFVLAHYNIKIFLIFNILNIISIFWIFVFQNKRKELDYEKFSRNKENQDKLFEMIYGMQEIKLYGSEISKTNEWQKLQIKYFNTNSKSLKIDQIQQAGFVFVNHLKNILIIFISAYFVLNGLLTIGALLSISYIIGQSISPIEQLIIFIKSLQDAKLSMDRLQDIHTKSNEESKNFKDLSISELDNDINIENLSFQYDGKQSPYVLKNLKLLIPKNKITAIVGTSGSGKTTLMKLLLGYFDNFDGTIKIGDSQLGDISPKIWRSYYGTVLQDGYIFNDTILNNIALDGNEINKKNLDNAINISNINDLIHSLPLGFDTKIGNSGFNLSGGEKQRILIARAIYKNPKFLFLDEATSSLDSKNEKIIMDNLNGFFKNKTVVIIAHRLSTVQNADQILVLDSGEIHEIGNHNTLVNKKGKYFDLVKNQLSLGN